MRDHQEELEELNAAALLVCFVGGARAREWLTESGASFPLLLDEGRDVYRAYGLGQARLSDWTPRVIWNYLKWIVRGYLPQRVSGDPYQLGGDFIVDSTGVVRFAHPSGDATDRPSVECLLAAIREIPPRV